MKELTILTHDSWGHAGVATYKRTDFDEYGAARVEMSDTSSGHGWCGYMSAGEWLNLERGSQEGGVA